MKSLVLSLLGSLLLVVPVSAKTGRHHRHGHIVGTQPKRGETGLPITAASDSIRINGVGEVISQPVPVIQKERNFDSRARQQLSVPQPQIQPASPAPKP